MTNCILHTGLIFSGELEELFWILWNKKDTMGLVRGFRGICS